MHRWKKTKYIPENIMTMLRYYRGIGEVNHFEISAINDLLFPASAIAFREWRFRGTYRDNLLMSLELDQPYLYLLLDIPKDREVSSLERDVWILYMKGSIYGGFGYDMISPASVEQIIDEKSVVVAREKKQLVYDCIPMLQRFEIIGIEELKKVMESVLHNKKSGRYIEDFGKKLIILDFINRQMKLKLLYRHLMNIEK